MKKFKQICLLAVLFIVGITALPYSTSHAAANYVTATKTVNPASILVGEEAEVTLNIQGTPPVNVVKPNDVILVIDRSGSMGTEKMNSAKAAAKGFIDLMDLTKHQIGVVDYESNAYPGVPLTTDAAVAKSYIDRIYAGGGTGTAPAIEKAQELLASHRPDAQPVIVLLTDGDATVSGDGLTAYEYTLKKAEEAKSAGIVFYTIALLDVGTNPDTSGPNKLLKDMATTSHHHHFVLGSTGLAEIYGAIVQEIGLASAYDVIVTDIVPNSFEIVPGSYESNIPKPTVTGNTLKWSFLELKNDTLSFTYKIRHKAESKNGLFPITQAGAKITYKDYTGSNLIHNLPNVNLEVKYPAPVITSVTPDKGVLGGGEVITIKGENFLPDAKVYLFNNFVSSGVTVVDDKTITVTTPPGKQGQVEVKVVNPDNQSAKSVFNYYVDPVVTDITPNNGPIQGGTTVRISGKYFMKGITVKFGDQSAAVTYNNDASLYVKAPAVQQWGIVDLTFENPDGTTLLVKDAYTYNEPPKIELTSISPAEGLVTGNESIVLTGKEFKAGTKVYFNSIESTNVIVNNSQTMTVKTPVWSQPETVDIKVVSPDASESVLAQAFTYLTPPPPPAPEITNVSPSTTRMDTSVLTYIDGANFVSGVKVDIGDATNLDASYLSSTRLRVRVPVASESGVVDIKVTNPDGQFAVKAQAFTYESLPELPAPTIRTVTPANGPMSGGTLIYIDGSNFQVGAVLEWIEQSKTTTINADFLSNSRLRLRAPATTEHGPVDIKVINPDGKEVVAQAAFSYDAPPVFPDPVITSITPNSGNKSGGGILDIYGDEFRTGAKVTMGTQTVDLYAFVSKSHIRIKVPASPTAAAVDVTVTNPDGKSVTLTQAYSYEEAKPEVTGISPSNGPLAGGTLVYIDGKYLETGLTVTFNGSPINYDYMSSSRIRIKTPAASVPGAVNIVITNPSGAATTTQFTYDAPPPVPAPTLKTLSPTSGPVSGGTLLYVDGSNYKSGAVVNIDGVSYTAEFISTTRLRLRTPKASSPGVVLIKVINPDGQESGTLNFEYK